MLKYAMPLFAVASAHPATAQEWVNIDIWGNGILSQSALRHAEEATRQSGNRAEGKSKAPVQQRDRARAALPFQRSGDLTGEIEEGVARQLPKMVSLRFQMDDPARFVRTAGTRAIYRKELAARGFPEDSVAGATALFLSVGWELANGRRLSAAQNRAIFQQAAAGLRSTPLARQSDARRQQESEMRMIISALWLQEARLRARSAGSTQQLSDAVWRDMKAITKNDMRAYRVSEKGFVDL